MYIVSFNLYNKLAKEAVVFSSCKWEKMTTSGYVNLVEVIQPVGVMLGTIQQIVIYM